MARLIVTLLGGFRARLESGIPLALPTRKAQALPAYLAVPPGSAHPRDKLASLLWGNAVETTDAVRAPQEPARRRSSTLGGGW
jgi:DNA-binding SARP family transcriptional activator